uniref:Uncharacterized protein n=1 Tax=Alexandrium monilatum TaxID=311494 RepID=A0A7S4VUQ0_9DINO
MDDTSHRRGAPAIPGRGAAAGPRCCGPAAAFGSLQQGTGVACRPGDHGPCRAGRRARSSSALLAVVCALVTLACGACTGFASAAAAGRLVPDAVAGRLAPAERGRAGLARGPQAPARRLRVQLGAGKGEVKAEEKEEEEEGEGNLPYIILGVCSAITVLGSALLVVQGTETPLFVLVVLLVTITGATSLALGGLILVQKLSPEPQSKKKEKEPGAKQPDAESGDE